MASTVQDTPEPLTVLEPTLLPDGPILVATDTSIASDAAFPVAAALAERARADVVALSVVEPTNMPIYGVDGVVISMENASDTLQQRDAATRAQLIRMVSSRANWPVLVKPGEPAQEIVTTAAEHHARLIVVGRGRHAGLDRVLGGEAVLRMLQLGGAPVLAVQLTLTSLPRRVVIATDFSPFSTYAAQVAMTVVAPDAEVWVIHVAPALDESVPYLRARADIYREETQAAFAQLRPLLARRSVTVHDVIRSGRAADEILRLVAEQGADLVVSATHGYGFLRRMILGSVGAALVRNAPCSVLVVPGSARTMAAARARMVPNARTRTFDVATFDTELAAFSQRNSGRRCLVEVDQAEIGAQLLGHELLLSGASFDRHGSAVALMFGATTLKGLHVTHHVTGVTEIAVSSNAGGQDQVLRVAHPGGQVLVSLS
jgi:nucleotide-binding universal stress UspA family protein